MNELVALLELATELHRRDLASPYVEPINYLNGHTALGDWPKEIACKTCSIINKAEYKITELQAKVLPRPFLHKEDR